MNPKPNRESRMDERALPTDLQTTDLVGTSIIRGNDEEGQRGEKGERQRQRKQSLPDSGQNSTLGQDGDSRDSLGTLPETSVRTSVGEESQARIVVPVQLLLQLPVEELGRLHVYVDTPPFDDLTPATRRSVIAAMDRQEEMHLRGETRQSANHVMAYALAVLDEPSPVHEIQASVRAAAELREGLLAGSLELVDLERRHRHENVMNLEFYADRDRRVVQLNSSRLIPSGDQLENRLIKISADVERLAANASEEPRLKRMLFEIVPHSMTVVPFSDDRDYRRVPGPRQSTYGRYRAFILRRIP